MNTTREEVKALLAATCPDWEVTYEASRMMSVKATGKAVDAKFVYIEEFTSGKYLRPIGRPGRTMMTRVQIWFCMFKLDANPNTRDRPGFLDASAEEREKVREWIEANAVQPFLDGFSASAKFTNKPTEIPFGKPLPRFPDGEVSVMIELDVQLIGNC